MQECEKVSAQCLSSKSQNHTLSVISKKISWAVIKSCPRVGKGKNSPRIAFRMIKGKENSCVLIWNITMLSCADMSKGKRYPLHLGQLKCYDWTWMGSCQICCQRLSQLPGLTLSWLQSKYIDIIIRYTQFQSPSPDLLSSSRAYILNIRQTRIWILLYYSVY